MQGEFDLQYPDLGISIIGINEAGYESGNDSFCDGRDIPWLQDTSAANWWGTWNPVYRDVIILDENGELADVYNVTNASLLEEANYVELKSLIVEVAGG